MTSLAVEPTVQMQIPKQREKLLDIERGKGIGILLVVYGHLVMFNTLGEQGWYRDTKAAVYLFHMPLFMYLSGFVFFYTKAHLAFERGFPNFLAKRFDRLILPFLALALITVLGKALASQFVYVDQGVSGIWDGIAAVFSNAPQNPAISIWYLAVLFVYSVATPVFIRLLGGHVWVLFALALAAHFIPLPEDFYLGRIFRFYVFFVFGMVASRYAAAFLYCYSRCLIGFLLAFVVLLYFGRSLPYSLLLCGLVSIPVVHGFVASRLFFRNDILVWLGQNSMVIYLLNTIAIGIAKAAYVRVLPLDGSWFVLMIAILMLAGTALPLIFKYALGFIPYSGPVTKYIR